MGNFVTKREKLIEAIKAAEQSPNPTLRDEVAYLLGKFPRSSLDFIQEAKATDIASRFEHTPVNNRIAMIEANRQRNREDVVGVVADALVRLYQD